MGSFNGTSRKKFKGYPAGLLSLVNWTHQNNVYKSTLSLYPCQINILCIVSLIKTYCASQLVFWWTSVKELHVDVRGFVPVILKYLARRENYFCFRQKRYIFFIFFFSHLCLIHNEKHMQETGCMCVCVPRYVIIHSGTAIEEYDDSHDGCRDQHLCVDS